ncbi:MAG: hypothetical protein IJI45_11480 [Anaerolineaceae bacterium]|nr:hypothetical protein [Anaerolineaceae bacterium]
MKYDMGKPAKVLVDIEEYTRLKHGEVNNKAGVFLDGVCFAVIVYCFIYSCFFIL